MEELLQKFAEQLLGRIEGPMNFRLLLQPAIACFLAFRDGSVDAKNGHPPYFWSLFTRPEHRAERLRQGWKSISKVFVVAILLDLVFQYMTNHQLIPRQAVILAFILAIIPYLAVRGLVTRVRSSAGKQR